MKNYIYIYIYILKLQTTNVMSRDSKIRHDPQTRHD